MRNPTNHITRRVILAVLVILAALLMVAPSALASEGCPNEQLRKESNIDPATGQSYDTSLPECRAYEMVSPLDKGGFEVEPVNKEGVPVAPEGDTVGFQSIRAFAGVENVTVAPGTGQDARYLARRTGSGWVTEGAFPPASVLNQPLSVFPGFSADLNPKQVACGSALTTNDSEVVEGYRCALGRAGGSWVSTPGYKYLNGNNGGQINAGFLGSSADLSRAIIQLDSPLLPADDRITGGQTGLYEVAGVGTPSPELRLVNVDNYGNELIERVEGVAQTYGPLFGDARGGPTVNGTSYHAISESGETVFFSATPTEEQLPAGEQQTVYARLHHSETVAVSNPSPAECTTCSPTPEPATYQGASANGEKVFFTTAQQLVNGDTDETTDLYEYDFAPGHHVVQLSAGGVGDPTPGVGANVQGVIRTSSDGSHVYFVATGVLTIIPNSLGEIAQPGADNLYGVDTRTGETKFVGELCAGEDTSGAVTDERCPTFEPDAELWGEDDSLTREAQTTLDGRYLVFSTFAHLATDDTNNAQAAYRYDFQTGELTWLSRPAPGFAVLGEGLNAVIAPIQGSSSGGDLDVNDWSRAITGNGEDVIFTTAEKLQADDVNSANDVYLWHNGAVSMISDGRDPAGVSANIRLGGLESAPWSGISESGSDVFFFTTTPLVGQDIDVYQDLYDARIGGGFPASKATPSCSGEEWTCQGKGAEPPSPPSAVGSATQQAGGNLSAAPFKELLEPEPKPKSKPLTSAQRLAAALKACKRAKTHKKRQACEASARKKYPPKTKAKKK